MSETERSFTKTRSNNQTEKQAVALLLSLEPRFQVLPSPVKNGLLDALGLRGEFTNRVFDLVMTPTPMAPLELADVVRLKDEIVLIETKSTKKPIQDENLHGFFFGATDSEYRVARRLGSRYLFAFTVLNPNNPLGRPFFKLLDIDAIEARTQSKRIQYQVNFGRKTA